MILLMTVSGYFRKTMFGSCCARYSLINRSHPSQVSETMSLPANSALPKPAKRTEEDAV